MNAPSRKRKGVSRLKFQDFLISSIPTSSEKKKKIEEGARRKLVKLTWNVPSAKRVSYKELRDYQSDDSLRTDEEVTVSNVIFLSTMHTIEFPIMPATPTIILNAIMIDVAKSSDSVLNYVSSFHFCYFPAGSLGYN